MHSNSDTTVPAKEAKRSFDVPIFIRRAMSLLEFIHWRLALKFALKLFFTPIKFPVPKREISIRELGTEHIIPLGDKQAQLFEWGRGDKKVIMMHGWSGRASQFFRLIETLVEEGYHVFSIEAPAHGLSVHKQTDMLEFVRSIEWTIENFGPVNTAIGHSLGGVALFNAHARNRGAFREIITIGSPANIYGVVNDFCEVVNAGPKVADGIIRSIEKTFSLKVEDVSLDELAQTWNPPGLIFHDEQDADVSVDYARHIARLWTNAQAHISKGYGHRRILSEPSVHQAILEFLN